MKKGHKEKDEILRCAPFYFVQIYVKFRLTQEQNMQMHSTVNSRMYDDLLHTIQ